MILDLRELIAGTVAALPFSADYPGEGLTDDLVSGSVHVQGAAENHAGFLSLTGNIRLTGVFRCARCCAEFPKLLDFPLESKLAESLANEDEEDFLLLEDGQLDLDEAVREQLLTEMPYRFLCREDCKGLCPKCGQNLNDRICSCDTRETDPRWTALKSFFEEESNNTTE